MNNSKKKFNLTSNNISLIKVFLNNFKSENISYIDLDKFIQFLKNMKIIPSYIEQNDFEYILNEIKKIEKINEIVKDFNLKDNKIYFNIEDNFKSNKDNFDKREEREDKFTKKVREFSLKKIT